MNTQLLLNFKPNRSNILEPYTNLTSEFLSVNDPLLFDISKFNKFSYRPAINPNWSVDTSSNLLRNDKTLANIDLFEDTAIPLNFTILDVREPEKRKTNFSKTIRLPGTKNNNKLFNHVYEISGNSKFNPNLRTEVVILQDGVQVIRGNMQLKRINVFNNNDIEYEVIITGDFTSLFADIGLSKISDLDFSEYEHTWDRNSIVLSWDNIIRKNGEFYNNAIIGSPILFENVDRESETGRVQITTTTEHGFKESEWVRISPNGRGGRNPKYGSEFMYGEWQVAEVKNNTTFTVNYPYPEGIYGLTIDGEVRRWQPTGEGYAYGMISWGDDTIIPNPVDNQSVLPTFPVTNFVMGFYVKEIWDKIFKETNSRYESEFLNSDTFKRLTMFQKKTKYDLLQSQVESREFKVANTTQHSIRISGFGPDDSGDYGNQLRSFPYNDSNLGRPYEFNADIESSQGLLYNGKEGSRPYNDSISKWRVTDSGYYDLTTSIVVRLKTEISDYTAEGNLEPISGSDIFYWGADEDKQEDVYVLVRMLKRSNGLTTTITSETLTLTKTNEDYDTPDKTTFKDWLWLPKQATLSFQDQYLLKDDDIWINVSFVSDFDNINKGVFTKAVRTFSPNRQSVANWTLTPYRGIVDIETVGVQYFTNKSDDQIVEGSLISPKQFLPKDMSCKDFLISIIRMFNLHIESDKEIENFYYIEPRNDYYEDGSNGTQDYEDWTNKVDVNSIQLTPMGELNAKFYNFTYREDNDYWNRKYLDDTGKLYGSYVKEIENDFLSNEQKIETTFGSSVMINSPRGSNMVIPQIVQKDNNNQNKVMNTSSKILLWGGPRPTSSNGVAQKWSLLRNKITEPNYSPEQDLYTSYPYVGTIDSPFDPLDDINWFYTEYVYWDRARWSNDNLYNRYWAGFIEEISDPDSKLVTASLRLNPKDIYNLDFKKIYVINGHYLRLQKIIDYNANGKELTRCEFLKLKSPSKFKKESINVSDSFESGQVNFNSIENISIKPPQNFKDRYPISNYSESAISGVFNANLNGQNNIISQNANNISIQGNENYIGSKSNNISINGNGVQVAGGIRNVNVIGTDNVFIDESNVTYINGIRYKNGVAISKSNVIDGSINSSVGKSSINTTPNVIDASEDIVIESGSNSYEDVINAGQDRILPDLSSFNVSTQTTPRPSTNFSGVAITEIGLTASLPELIERRINPVPYSAFNAFKQ